MASEPTSSIQPDTKDWTWVLDERCPECGYDATELDVSAVGSEVRTVAARLGGLLADPRANLRPNAQQWSAVEYGCHVRDVFRLFDTRLRLMLAEDDPLFANWDQDATAIEDDYASQESDQVADELIASAEIIAASFEAVTDDELLRKGRRSDGAGFTVDSFARYFLHDPIHHVWDVEQGYSELGGA